MEKEAKKVVEKATTEKKATKSETKKIKPLVTSRVLFISVLDKILLVMLVLYFIILTWANFSGTISSSSYGYWARVGREILIILLMGISYFFVNWVYKCAAKTMLCLTKNEVYKEQYVPFKRMESSIPLNKITGVSSYNFFWIFRCIIIFQYNRFPLLFWTWNAQEFKDELTELITTDKDPVENEFEDKNIVSKEMLKYFKYAGVILVAIISLIGIVKLFNFALGGERNVPGTYEYNGKEIVLNKDGSCNIDGIQNNVTECKWTFIDDKVTVNYTYEYKPNYSTYSSTYTGSITYDYNNKTLIDYNNKTYTKK